MISAKLFCALFDELFGQHSRIAAVAMSVSISIAIHFN